MPNTRPPRVLGPYGEPKESPKRWRVVAVAPDGKRRRRTFASSVEAETYAEMLRQRLAADELTTETALDLYEQHLKARGNKPGSIKRTRWSVSSFFPTPVPLWALRPETCEAAYAALVPKYAVDSHRNILAEVKTFVRWCVKKSYLAESPVEHVEGVGRRVKGKPQLRIKNARRWFAKALELAEDGDDGAIAALIALLLGLRSTKIVTLKVGSFDEVDEPFDTVWIEDAKTAAGNRELYVPEVLRPLIAGQCEAKTSDSWVFPARGEGARHDRGWVIDQVHRICLAANVPKVSAHSLRGLLATLNLRAGVSADAVARTLGHEDKRTTVEAYAAPGSAAEGERKRGLKILSGGKK